MSSELESMNFANYRYFNVSFIKLGGIAKYVYAKKVSDTTSVVDIYDMLRILLPREQTLSTAQKMKFSIKGFFSKCDQIRNFLRIWSHLLKKSLMENFIFCARKF